MFLFVSKSRCCCFIKQQVNFQGCHCQTDNSYAIKFHVELLVEAGQQAEIACNMIFQLGHDVALNGLLLPTRRYRRVLKRKPTIFKLKP